MYQSFFGEYPQNMLVYLQQDLSTLYVYWNFSTQRNWVFNDFLKKIKIEYRLIIKLCHFDKKRKDFIVVQEVPLATMESGKHYFTRLNPIDTYHLELGVYKPDGGFICFYRTAPIRMQPVNPLLDAGEVGINPLAVNSPDNIKTGNEDQLNYLIIMSNWS
jgi:hypothetical protein